MSSGAVRVGLTLENRAVDTEETREGISCRDRGWGSGKLRGWSSSGSSGETQGVQVLRAWLSGQEQGRTRGSGGVLQLLPSWRGAGCAPSAASSRTREDHSPHFGTFQNASPSWAAPAQRVMKIGALD